MKTIQLEIKSRETIKPSSPIPNHLKDHHKFSLFDELYPHIYVPLLLFYPSKDCHRPCNKNIADITNQLKKSLSETLTKYYLLAFILKDGTFTDCNNEGALVLEAHVKCKLSEVLKNPEGEMLNLLFPDDLQWRDAKTGTSLVVQINFFECGGMALGVCMSHKIADMASMCTFINDWANIAHNPAQEVSPEFNLDSMFSSGNLPIKETEVTRGANCITKRFLFDASNIAILKSIVSNKVKNPTKVEVLTALIQKCLISTCRAKLGTLKPSLLFQAVNLRTRVVPRLPESCIGNLTWCFPVLTSGENEIALDDLVSQMRQEFVRLCEMYTKKFRGPEWLSLIIQNMKESSEVFFGGNTEEVYSCSSWCRFPLYQIDFGWGEPIWVATSASGPKNLIVMIDTRRGDGVEVYVTLDEEDMVAFEQDQELLTFASVNPSALICF